VFLLGDNDASASLDRRALRALGAAQVRRFLAGRDALAALGYMLHGKEEPASIVCQETLADMNCIEFLCQLRSLPETATLPVVTICSASGPFARAARKSASCALICRPYTQEDLVEALAAANSAACLRAPLPLAETLLPRESGPAPRGPQAASREQAGLQKIMAAGGKSAPRRAASASPAALFQAGFVALRFGDEKKAERLLSRCHALDPSHAECCLTLARLHCAIGEEDAGALWLCRAGIAFLRRNEPLKASEVFARMPRQRVAGEQVTPLLYEIIPLLRSAEYKAAALAFLEGCKLDPETPLYAMISRACLFTSAPETALQGLYKAFAALGYASTAQKLRLRLFLPPAPEAEPERSGFLERFPVLYEIFSVASQTYTAWKNAV
jgi:tetratricopeptide (TPR) repeat protein